MMIGDRSVARQGRHGPEEYALALAPCLVSHHLSILDRLSEEQAGQPSAARLAVQGVRMDVKGEIPSGIRWAAHIM